MESHPTQLIVPPTGQREPAPPPQRPTPDIPWSLIVKAIIVIVAGYAAIRLLGILVPVLLVLLESLLLTCALTPPVHWLMRRGVGRGLAVAIVLIGIAVAVVAFIALITPPIITEGESTAAALPGYVNEMQGLLSRFPSVNKQVQSAANTGAADPGAVLPFIASSGGNIISGVSDFIAVIFVSAYLLAGGERSFAYVEHYLPERFLNKIRRATPGVIRVVSGYVFGQAATSLLFGIFTFITLTILGVPQPLLLSVLAAALDAIPLVGTLFATAAAVLMALSVSPTVAIIVLALFLAYNVLESNIILPRIFGRAMGISSLVVLVAILIGYRLIGLIGVFVALPLAAAIPPAERAWRQEELLIGRSGSNGS